MLTTEPLSAASRAMEVTPMNALTRRLTFVVALLIPVVVGATLDTNIDELKAAGFVDAVPSAPSLAVIAQKPAASAVP